MIGCGSQAATQVAAVRAAVPAIDEVYVFCRDPVRREKFGRQLGATAVETHREAAEQDVVVTITTSKDPVLRGEWLRPGALVCAAGANVASRRELDNAVLERAAFVCCDSKENAKLESGDLIEPVDAGRARLARGARAGRGRRRVSCRARQSDDDIVVFKSNGLAAWDLAAGAALLARAKERGVGVERSPLRDALRCAQVRSRSPIRPALPRSARRSWHLVQRRSLRVRRRSAAVRRGARRATSRGTRG